MRVTPEEMERRKRHLLQTAVLLMGERGIDRVSQNEVAAEAGVAHGNVQNYFGSYDQMKDAVVNYAAANKADSILAQAAGHPRFKYLLTKTEIQRAIRYLKDY